MVCRGLCPTVWPDVSMMGANNLRRVVGYDFHHYAGVGRQVAHVEADGFGEIREKHLR